LEAIENGWPFSTSESHRSPYLISKQGIFVAVVNFSKILSLAPSSLFL
jgi:hypothetical protein